MPEFLTEGGIGLLEADLVQEAAFKGRIQVLGEVGGGYEDAVQGLHLLEDYVLDAVFHFVHCRCRAFAADADDAIGLIEKEDGDQF